MIRNASAPVLLFILALVALLGIIGLTITDHKVPDVLQAVVMLAAGGAAGAAIPSRGTTTARPGP